MMASNVDISESRPALSWRAIEHLASAVGSSKRELEKLVDTVESRYRSWTEPKKRGGQRKIDAPSGRLKEVQERLSALLAALPLPDAQYGGRPGRDNIANATVHVGADFILTLDIRSFFPMISHRMVYRSLLWVDCSPDVARAISRLVTFRGRLPQGAPTSTAVANIVVAPLVGRLARLAREHGAKFTQYVDDIAFSGPKHLRTLEPLIKRIVKQERFQVRGSKTQRSSAADGPEVTGVRVGTRLHANDRIRAEIESKLFRLTRRDLPEFRREQLHLSLQGQIGYVRRIDPELAEKLDECVAEVRSAHADYVAELVNSLANPR